MATLFFLPRSQAVQLSGIPYAGARLYFYEAGTLIAKVVHQDINLATPHPQPVPASDQGFFPRIYLNEESTTDYRVILKTAADVQIYDSDDYPASPISLDQDDIAEALNPRSAAEQAANATISNALYLEGDIRRYGARDDGVTACRTAIQAAFDTYAQGGAAVYIPAAATGWLCETPAYIPTTGLSVHGEGYRSRIYTALTAPLSIFRCGTALGLTGVETSHVLIRGVHFDGRRKTSGIAVPGSRSRLNALVFLGTDSTLGSNYTSDIEITDCFFSESVHNHLSFESCDGVRIRNVVVNGNGLDASNANYLGNTDGIHFNNCRNFSVNVAKIKSGDDMIGITSDANGLGTSYGGRIHDVQGSSREANGVVVNGEGGSTKDLYDMQISKIRFESETGQGVAVRAKKIASEAVSQVIFRDIIGRGCGRALDFDTVSDCHADDIHGYDTTDHAISISTTTDCSLGRHSSRNAGNNTGSWNGLHAVTNTRLKVSGSAIHYRADQWGVNWDSNTDSTIDDVYAHACGRKTSIGAERGGIRAASNIRAVFGSRLGASDDGTSLTNYGFRSVTADTNSVLQAPLLNFTGVTNGINNSAGIATTNGGMPIAAINFTDNGSAVTVVASKNTGTPTRNAQGNVDVPFATGMEVYRTSDGHPRTFVINGDTGADTNDVIGKWLTDSLGSVNLRWTNGGGALAAITRGSMSLFGTVSKL